ncbi:MAG: SCO2322 family protein [Actinomycetota bacterium]|nr:SCO2322 family protein [Actinomycetota bacterium]
MRLVARATCLSTAICLAVLVFAPAARAETAYRYWTFWTVGNGQWVFSQVGPAGTAPVDGDVQAWRFAVTANASGSTSQPRTDPTQAFERICGSVQLPEGQIRVAMVIDPGVASAAPVGQSPPPARGACAVIDESKSGVDALMAVATPRVQSGLVCGIDAYPTGECAIAIDTTATSIGPDEVTDILAAPSTATNESAVAAVPSAADGSPVPLIAVGVVIALGLVGAWVMQRRRVP